MRRRTQTQNQTRGERTWQNPHVDASAPTPGVDDSPYIQFAIEQITRDEEIAGKGRESKIPRKAVPSTVPASTGTALNEGPRISAFPAPPATAVVKDTSRRSKALAVAAPVVIEEAPQESRVASSNYSPVLTEKSPIKRSPSIAEDQEPLIEEPAQIFIDTDVEPQTSQLFPPLTTRQEKGGTILLPVVPKANDFRYPPLNFVPGPLRLLPILALIVLCLGLIGILLCSTALGAKNYGLLGYDGVGTTRYFVFEYLPQLLAAIVVVWLFAIQAAIQRILPFVLLARSNGYPDEEVFERVPIYLTNYLLPNKSLLRRNFGLKFCAIIFWLTLITIPLASSLYQTRWYAQISNGSFLWTTVQPVSIALIVIYTLLIIALVITYVYFNRHTTGLKWDPVSLADIIALLRRTSNLTSSRTSRSTRLSSTRPHSLGYWESTSRPGEVFHGIGAAHETPLASHDNDSINNPEGRTVFQQSTFESWHSHYRTRNKIQPSFLRESRLILYSIIAISLLIAFLVVTYLHSGLKAGFLPLLPTATSSTSSFTSFSSSDFLYSFVPSFIGLLLPLFWVPIDTAFRYLQPWSTLTRQYPSSASQAFGHTASSTLLLSYPSTLPILVSIRSLFHGHIRVAWFSLLTLISWTIPVLAGGLFTAQYIASAPDPALLDQSRGGSILIRPDTNTVYIMTAFVLVYALSWPLTLPGAKRRSAIQGPDGKPVDVRYLAWIRAVVDKSVLREAIWTEPRTRVDLVTRLAASEGHPKERMSGRWAMVGGRIIRT